MVEDSLLALSKRQAMIENFVNREIRDINNNTTMALESMQNRAVAMAASKQQYVMTSVNNLALLLSESLKNMEQTLSMNASGKFPKGNPKPGQGKNSMKSMRQMQEKLNEQMEKLREGRQPSPGKEGEQGQSGKAKMSEQLARIAAQQEALRKMLQKYSEELQKTGDVNQQGLQKAIQEMEKTETDLVNKRINKETMKRQQEILTRLLESEKAEMKREQQERRESNEGKELPKPDPAKYFDSIGLPSKETELIKTIPPSLRDYYKNKVNSYFIQIPSEHKSTPNGH
jgi:low affinity Fe/Cu permease